MCRAWLATATADAFRGYVDHEKILRRELQKAAESGMSLKRWKRRMLLDPAMRPCRKGVIDLDYMHDAVPAERWISLDHLLVDDATHDDNRSVVDRVRAQALGETEPDARDKRPDHPQQRFAVRLAALVEALVDWRPHVADRAALNQALLLLQARLDNDPDLVADVYLMRGLLRRRRSLNKTNGMNLFEGRRPEGDRYQGDAAFFTDGRVSLQIYSVDVEGEGKKVLHQEAPALTLRVPRDLAGGILHQPDDRD